MVSCVSYTNKNRVYDRQSLSAPAYEIWFWKNQLYCFSRIASAVSVSASSKKSTVAFPEQYSFTTFKHGKKRLNYAIVLRWSAFDIWVSWLILLVQKEKICTFCLWSETSKSPWIFKPCNV